PHAFISCKQIGNIGSCACQRAGRHLARGHPPQDLKEASMHTVRRTQPSRGRMRGVRMLIAGAAATAAALSVVGLAATAQAQPTPPPPPPPHSVGQLAGGSDPSGPAGVATSVHLPSCSSGPVTVTSSPALPTSVHAVVNGTKAQLAGVWPKAATFKIILHC